MGPVCRDIDHGLVPTCRMCPIFVGLASHPSWRENKIDFLHRRREIELVIPKKECVLQAPDDQNLGKTVTIESGTRTCHFTEI
jgi:hypothetical protein